MDSILKFKLVYSNFYTIGQPIPNGFHPAVVDKIKAEFDKNSSYHINSIYNDYDGHLPFFHCNLYHFFRKFHADNPEQDIISIDDVDPNDTNTIYVYPIEIKTTLASLSNKQNFKLDGVYYEYTLVDTLSEKELNLLRNKKMLLLINLVHDPVHHSNDIVMFEHKLNLLGINGEVCHYTVANNYEGHKKLGSQSKVHLGCIPLSQYSNWLSSTIPIEGCRWEYALGPLGYPNKFVLPSDIDASIKRNKKFLCFNRTNRSHRVVLFYLAIKNNWLQNGMFSFIFPFNSSDIGTKLSLKEELINFYPKEENPEYFAEKMSELLPYELDTQHIPPQQKNGFGSNNNNQQFYLDSYLHIVSETSFYKGNETTTLTEKTFRPICNLQPFIQIGDAHSLSLLKSYGFKTFSPYIDESYDAEVDPIKRMIMIEKELNRINNMSMDEIHEWYHSMMEILIYNQEHMKTFVNHNAFENTFNEIASNRRQYGV